MKAELLNAAIVVVAREHTPSMLHPSFLESQGIVSSDWKLLEPPICTPPISIVKYNNGVVLTAESNKLQVLQTPVESSKLDLVIPELTSRYIEKFPHISYIAVGVNFAFIIPCPEPESLIIQIFIKEKVHDLGDLKLKSASIRLAYPISTDKQRVVLNVSCEPKEVIERGEAKRGILVSANYHHYIDEEKTLEDTMKAISTFESRLTHFKDVIIPKLFGAEVQL